jgi:transcriptional regulator with XRE-family HTH domain
MAQSNVHHGKNLRRFREWKGLKQEALALELGDDWTQKKISLLEQKEQIQDAILKQLAGVLKVPVEAFDALNEDPAVNIIGNTFTANDQAVGGMIGDYNLNPIEKWMEALAENKALYERLLKEKDDMIARLEAMIKR